MYKYKSGQISITDFGQPMGMHLNENNRWVKKAAMIPWGEIEKRYAGLFKSHKGNPAKPLPDRKQNYIDECEREHFGKFYREKLLKKSAKNTPHIRDSEMSY